MKNIALFVVTLLSLKAYCQCCPYFESATISPPEPTTSDFITLHTVVTTPNLGSYLGATVNQIEHYIVVRACYYSGMATALQTYHETVNIGTLPANTYTLQFRAVMSEANFNCDNPVDSVEHTMTFTVVEDNSTNSRDKLTTGLHVAPNPADAFVVISGAGLGWRYSISDLSGRIWKKGTVSLSPMDISDCPAGMYLVRAEDPLTGQVAVSRLIKQ